MAHSPSGSTWSGAERQVKFLVADDLQQRSVAQGGPVVCVLIAGDELLKTLPQQGERAMLGAIRAARIRQLCGPVAGQMMTVIEGPQRRQPGIVGDLPARKISVNGLAAVKGESQL